MTRKVAATTATTQSAETVHATESTHSETVTTASAAPQHSWALGLDWSPWVSQNVYKPVAAELDYRVGGPIWVQGQYNWQSHTTLLGVKWEF